MQYPVGTRVLYAGPVVAQTNVPATITGHFKFGSEDIGVVLRFDVPVTGAVTAGPDCRQKLIDVVQLHTFNHYCRPL